MSAKSHTVWMWFCPAGDVRYVGYGKFVDMHPALLAWRDRNDDESELNDWLQTFETEPHREAFGPRIVSNETAVAFVMGLRQRFGDVLLHSRGASTYCGGHPTRGVYRFCEKDLSACQSFTSVREAGRAMGVNASTITRRCKSTKNLEWGYLDGKDG